MTMEDGATNRESGEEGSRFTWWLTVIGLGALFAFGLAKELPAIRRYMRMKSM